MTFTSSSKLGNTLSKITDDRAAEKAALKSGSSNLRVCLTEVDKKHAGLKTTTLQELFHGSNSGNTFRTCFYVSKVEPSNLADACVTTKGKLCHKMQFLAKDVSTQFNNNVYRILLYTQDGLGANFFGKPANLSKDAAALKRMKEQVG